MSDASLTMDTAALGTQAAAATNNTTTDAPSLAADTASSETKTAFSAKDTFSAIMDTASLTVEGASVTAETTSVVAAAAAATPSSTSDTVPSSKTNDPTAMTTVCTTTSTLESSVTTPAPQLGAISSPTTASVEMPLLLPGDDALSLDRLPSEILLHICSFLTARFVVCTFAMVCKHFCQLVSEDIFWKLRIKKRWPKKYPAIPVISEDFNWKAACIDREEQYMSWINPEKSFDFFRFCEGMSASVDSVQLLQGGSRLAIGSRDRYLNILDIDKLDATDPIKSLKEAHLLTKMDAHTGWIWSMASLDTTLATGSWDMYVKFWDMEAGGQEINKIRCKSAVLSMHYESDFMVAGCFDKKVYHIDPRTPRVFAEKRYHKKPVLAVAANSNYIMTASEDSTLVLYDRRANRISQTLQLADFPMSMSYYDNQLWVGDKAGLVHLVDTADGHFDIVGTYNMGHHGKVTGIQYTLGALYTCSTDRTVRVHEPSAQPATIATLSSEFAEATCLHYSGGVLVSGYSSVSVGIWKPKSSMF